MGFRLFLLLRFDTSNHISRLHRFPKGRAKATSHERIPEALSCTSTLEAPSQSRGWWCFMELSSKPERNPRIVLAEGLRMQSSFTRSIQS